MGRKWTEKEKQYIRDNWGGSIGRKNRSAAESDYTSNKRNGTLIVWWKKEKEVHENTA